LEFLVFDLGVGGIIDADSNEIYDLDEDDNVCDGDTDFANRTLLAFSFFI
jgi:hypothetical protein